VVELGERAPVTALDVDPPGGALIPAVLDVDEAWRDVHAVQLGRFGVLELDVARWAAAHAAAGAVVEPVGASAVANEVGQSEEPRGC